MSTSEFSGSILALIYGGVYFLLILILAAYILRVSKQHGDNLSPLKFLTILWQMRGVFGPIIVHLYDTATDIGVLYEWYFLWQREKDGDDIRSLDMETLFWTAIAILCLYRFILGLIGVACTVSVVYLYGLFPLFGLFFNDMGGGWCAFYCCFCCICLCFFPLFIICMAIGFAFGATELVLHVAILLDQVGGINFIKETAETTMKQMFGEDVFHMKDIHDVGVDNKNNDTNGTAVQGKIISNNSKKNERLQWGMKAGSMQRGIQLLEAVLESFPQAILQCIFIIQSANDDYIRNNLGSSFILLILSMFGSLCSIATKYIWADSKMVIESSQSLFIKRGKKSQINADCTKQSAQASKTNTSDQNPRLKIEIPTNGHLTLQNSKKQKIQDKKQEDNLSINNDTSHTNNSTAMTKTEVTVDNPNRQIHSDNNDVIINDTNNGSGDINLNSTYLTCEVHKSYSMSAAYMARVVWRLSAVITRCVIFALLYIVLGGIMEAILTLFMIIVWYLSVIFCIGAVYSKESIGRYCSCVCCSKGCNIVWLVLLHNVGGWSGPTAGLNMSVVPINTRTAPSEKKYDAGGGQVSSPVPITLIFTGLVFQVGVLGIAGIQLYMLRVLENVWLMLIITYIAFDINVDLGFDLNCSLCVDNDFRFVSTNDRIRVFIYIGWISIIIYAILSIFMTKQLIRKEYSGNFKLAVQKIVELIDKNK